MSHLKLSQIEKRIDEISNTIDLCDPRFDQDVIENLESELLQIIKELENKTNKIKLRLV